MAVNLLNLIEMIPGASSVVNTIQSKIGDFLKVPSRIQADQVLVSKLLAIAQTKNDKTGISELALAQNALPVLMQNYNGVLPLVQQVSGQASSINTDLLASGAGLAEQITAIVLGLDKVESTLKSYQSKYKGSLTSTFFGTISGGSYWPWILGGAVFLLGGAWYFSRKK